MQRKWRRDWERSKSHKQAGSAKKRNPFAMLAKGILPSVAAAGLLLSSMSGVYANPTDGQITTGTGTISESGSTMTINQTSDKLGINWQGFSIGNGETVQFIQPGSNSVALNRVIGSDASSIYGSLVANGKVFLINTNGILFAPGAQVNVGGIVASTLNMSDSDFQAGNYTFSKDGNAGSVINQGTITAADYAVLLGPQVTNEGAVAARVSGLAAGNAVTLDFDGDNLLNVTVDTGAAGGSITNSGHIVANGGLVVMSAGTKSALLETVVNNSGYIEAASVNDVNGVICLEGNSVTNSGTLDASGKNAGQTGGTVTLSGSTVTLADGAQIDVSGTSSGGTLTVEADENINVNTAINTGNGNVKLRADSDADSSGTVVFGTNGKVVTDGTVSIYYNPSGTATYTINGTDTTVKNYAGPTDYSSYVQNTSGGAGNLTSYMLVNNLNELQAMNLNLAGTYALGTDIDASETSGWNKDADGVAAGFVPIGPTRAVGNKFTGLFDGDGHVISGLTMHSSSEMVGGFSGKTIGMFGFVDHATIRNVGLENVKITGRFTDGGGLAGSIYGSTIDNCYSTGTITNTGTLNSSIGGLIGYSGDCNSYWGGGIANSYSTVTVNGENIQGTAAGGLIGNSNNSDIINSYSTGALTITNRPLDGNNNAQVGGLVGSSSGSNITNSYSTGAVNVISTVGWTSVGGLAGTVSSGAIRNSYSTGTTTLTDDAGFNFIGGLVGCDMGGTYTKSYTTSPVTMNGGSSFVGGFAGITLGGITNSYSTGLVTDNGSGNFIGGFLGSDGTAFGMNAAVTNSYWDKETSGQGTGVGDAPNATGVTGLTTHQMMDRRYLEDTLGWDFTNTWYILDGYTRPFLQSEYSTTINNAHQLQLMAMDLGADYSLGRNLDLSGLFSDASGMWSTVYGFVPVGSDTAAFTGTLDGNGHTISGLTINSPALSALGLFGYTQAAAIHDIGLADVHITGGDDNTYVGAVAGRSGTGSSITNVYSTGTVSGGQHTGGLVGYNAGALATSYSMSTVSGQHNVGGLAGTNAGTITNSYYDVSGVVTGSGDASKAGGIAGANSGAITASYSAGAVIGTEGKTGGLVGDGAGGTLTDAVWATDTSGQTQGVGNDAAATGVTGLTTAQMSDSANYGKWNFSDIWSLSGARPILQWEFAGSNVITTLDQLLSIGNNLSGMYILGADIDLTGLWTPIGTDTAAFTGILKGNGYTLNGLTIDGSGASALGLFGYTQGATISSVNLTNVNITAGTGNLYVGSLAGYSGTGTGIINCTSSGTVTTGGNGTTAGGLVGYNAGTIENSANTAAVTASGTGSIIGGLAGLNDSTGSITGSFNRGEVTASGTGSVIGGLVGQSDGIITSSYNAAVVTAQGTGSNAGGLAGRNTGSLDSTYNTGTVTSEAGGNTIGGLAGENYGTITDSYSNGAVKTTVAATNNKVGGLVGTNKSTGDITGSYMIGPVTALGAGSSVGGLVGQNDGDIANSYSMVVTTGTGTGGKVGGLVGENTGTGSIDSSFSVGAVTGTGTVGGLVGVNDGTVANALWATDTSGQTNSVGSGSATGAQGLTFANTLQSANYTGWDTNIWGIADGFLPYLKWQYDGTPSLVFTGAVYGDVAARTINVVRSGTQVAQAYEFGANGLYYGIGTSGQTVDTVLLYVAGDPDYKANGLYYSASNSLAGDLYKNTLIVNCGSTTATNGTLGIAKGTLTTEDIIYTYVRQSVGTNVDGGGVDVGSNDITVNGNLQAQNFAPTVGALSATGDITINNTGDLSLNSTYFQDYMFNQQISAGGNIYITTGGNFILRHGNPAYDNITGRSAYTQLIAGGDITVNAKGGFVNYSGANALDAGGRWLVYAPDQLVYSTNVPLYYRASLYSTNQKTGSGYVNTGFNNQKTINILELYPISDEASYDVRGGLAGDFICWAGDTVPSTGSGFIFAAAKPGLAPLTAPQLQRREAIIAAYTGNDQTVPGWRLEAATLYATSSGTSTDILPFLTIVGEGIATEQEQE